MSGAPDKFGKHLACGMERTYGAHRISRLMLLGDGEPWIRHLGDDWLPTACYQCDHWHLAVHVREFCGREERRYRTMLDRALSDPGRLAAQLRAGRWRGDPERDIWGFTDLGGGGGPLPGPAAGAATGSGGAPRSFKVPRAGFVRR